MRRLHKASNFQFSPHASCARAATRGASTQVGLGQPAAATVLPGEPLIARSGVQETAVSYRAQRPSHLWHILTPLSLLCVLLQTLSLS
jgi:hypothetical protein